MSGIGYNIPNDSRRASLAGMTSSVEGLTLLMINIRYFTKYLAVLLFLVVFLCLGCGSNPSGGDDKNKDDTVIDIGFVEISLGEYIMGGVDCDTIGNDSMEVVYYYVDSVHVVNLNNTLSVGKFEISNAHYLEALQTAYDSGWVYVDTSAQTVCDTMNKEIVLLDLSSNHCEIYLMNGQFHWKTGYQNHPVKEVSWFGATAYTNWMSLIEGYSTMYDPNAWEIEIGCVPYGGDGYRLLTEAEWEYCASYDTTATFRIYPWGNTPPDLDYVNFNNYIGWTWPIWPLNDEYEHTKNRSFDQLYNLGGNICEWVNDWWDVYPDHAITDPDSAVGPLVRPEDQIVTQRVLRGGGWDVFLNDLKCAARYHSDPYHSSQYIGFRICRVVQ